ncbi:MAG TPA: hypothetical protein VE996_12915 [Terriglobales bacterium]|nr:hypothetical protein [Terriglobales bacterium]
MSRSSRWFASSRRLALLGLLLAVSGAAVGAGAQQTTPAASANGAAGVDPAYVAGYNAGYAAGQDDHAGGATANPHKFRAYQLADEGYTKAYGTLADYQRAYRSGFEDGYNDGYGQRPRSLGAAPAAAGPPPEETTPAPAAATASSAAVPSEPPPATPPSPASPQAAAAPPRPALALSPAKRAIGIGYREGYSAGEFDANRNTPYDFSQNTEYRLASAGYSESAGDFTAYQNNFRDGFRQGYDDGYHHRLYNSQIGIRTDTSIGPGGPGLLPTNPEVARARPSGVYENGILVEEGTLLQARLNNEISTKVSRPGDPFSATVSMPIWVGATLAIPAGSTLHGVVAEAQRGGLLHGGARLQLRYDTIEIPGRGQYSLHATTAGVGRGADAVNGSEGTIQHPNQNGQNVKRVVAPAAAGAIIGGIFGGGRGAAVLGGLGGAMGAAGVMVSRKRDLTLHIGEDIALRLDRPLELRGAVATSGSANP